MRPPRSRAGRRGGALLIALALLALAGALLAASAQSGRALARSALSHGAAIESDGECRKALAEFVSAWPSSYDSLAVGAVRETTIGPRAVGAAGMVGRTRVRLIRLSGGRYVIAAETSVGPQGVVAARRRLSLIIAEGAPSDTSTTGFPPAPIAQWSFADLF